jgi:hypothetical protein
MTFGEPWRPDSRNLASAFKSRKPSSAIPPARVAESWASTKGTTLQPRNKVLDKVIEIAIYAGLAAGLNDEAQITRLDIARKTLSEKIAHNVSNIAILNKEYSVICKEVVEHPDKRAKYWYSKLDK